MVVGEPFFRLGTIASGIGLRSLVTCMLMRMVTMMRMNRRN